MDVYRVVLDIPATGTQQHYDRTFECGGYRRSLSDMAHDGGGCTTHLGVG